MLKQFGLALALTLLGCGLAHADYPERTIKLIVPIAPGGLTDSLARIVADSIGKKLGQTVIVDNRSGAGGTLGMVAAAISSCHGRIGLTAFREIAERAGVLDAARNA